MNPEDILQKSFSGLKPEHLHELTQSAVQNTYPPDVVLCHEGELEHTFYVLVDGRVKVTRRMSDGEERLLATLSGGSFFGEMALIEDKPRSGTVTTTETTTVLEFPEDVFDSLLERSPSLALAMVRRVSGNLRASDRAAIEDLSRKNAELAQAYADLQAAQADIVAKERLERELEIAGEVQRSLLPERFPALPGYSFAGSNVPARTVGGDLYDVIRLDNEHVGLLMADVSDKGVHASLFMAVTRALFVATAPRSLSPRDVTLSVQKSLLEISPSSDMFVTVFYAVLHGPTGRLRYVRAGQDRPLLFRARGKEPVTIDAEGRFLGMLDGLDLEERSILVQPGDTLVMYSDGVTDAINPAGEPFGLERLVELLRSHHVEPPDTLCTSVFRDVFAFRGDAPAFDDITVLVAQAAEH